MIENFARPEHRSVSSLALPDQPAHESARRTTRIAYTALGWVLLFFAFHVYWYFGGSFASPGRLPGTPHSVARWIFAALVYAAFTLGAFACLTIAQGWTRGRLAHTAAALIWLGCALLLMRGGIGVVDDLTRATGILPNGLTGIPLKDAKGRADLTWSDWTIELYFIAGGTTFGLLALHCRAQQAQGPK